MPKNGAIFVFSSSGQILYFTSDVSPRIVAVLKMPSVYLTKFKRERVWMSATCLFACCTFLKLPFVTSVEKIKGAAKTAPAH